MKWNSIETFFLDMDGTLLDLAYDNYLWHVHVPLIFSKKNNIPFNDAKILLKKMYTEKKNSLSWYSSNYWSARIGINLYLEIKKTRNKIKVFPGVKKLLSDIKTKGRVKIILLTNCPREMLHIKLDQTKLWRYFDKIISSEDYGHPKESKEFWKILDNKVKYDKNKTAFIDDNINVLKYAELNGIKYLFAVSKPDSKKQKEIISNFKTLENIRFFKDKFID